MHWRRSPGQGDSWEGAGFAWRLFLPDSGTLRCHNRDPGAIRAGRLQRRFLKKADPLLVVLGQHQHGECDETRGDGY
jgi:hypothetical protein